jgi:hypothetical protein
MISIPARWSAALWCAPALLMMLGASSCDKDHPAVPTTTRRTKTLNCDETITVDPKKGPQPDSVYLCNGDTLTWQKGSGTDGFTIDFQNRTPFSDNAIRFNDQQPTHPAQPQYGALDVYKYTIIVTSGANSAKFDPQVIIGGNP